MSVSNTTKRVKEIRRKTRRKFSSEEKIRFVLEGLRGECSIAELWRREGIGCKSLTESSVNARVIQFVAQIHTPSFNARFMIAHCLSRC